MYKRLSKIVSEERENQNDRREGKKETYPRLN
jgi:hypothetical protein